VPPLASTSILYTYFFNMTLATPPIV
jgi:hypothetical protein